MDAFEQLIGEIFSSQGYWVQTSFKVELTKEEKTAIGRSSSPRWELDLVAYRPSINEILVIECKSYLDSTGVGASDLVPQEETTKSRYKLFVESELRKVVFKRLELQLLESGLCRANPLIKLGLACGRVKTSRNVDNRFLLKKLAAENNWKLYDENWINLHLVNMAQTGYQNKVSSVVAKIMERGESVNKYAHVAIKAVHKLQAKPIQPKNAWIQSAKEVFPNNSEAQKKECPKNAFLGLCAEGLIKGVPSGEYTKSIQNKSYAIKAADIFKKSSTMFSCPTGLWKQTLIELSEDENKTHNQQMHVVIALYELGFICMS